MPERTCIGCRAVKEKSALVRLAESNGALVVDPEGTIAGRGAYICRDEACIETAFRKKDPFSRALKRKVTLPDAKELWLKIKGRT